MSAIAMKSAPPGGVALAFVFLILSAGLSTAAFAEEPGSATKEEIHRVDLNAADVEELCTLPGIGPKKAEAIIAFREKRRFTRVTQLLRVRGIGIKTLQRLRPLLHVGPAVPSSPAAVPPKRPAGAAQSPGG